jgi:hypothetical protein
VETLKGTFKAYLATCRAVSRLCRNRGLLNRRINSGDRGAAADRRIVGLNEHCRTLDRL